MLILICDILRSVFVAGYFWFIPMLWISPYNPIIRKKIIKNSEEWYNGVLYSTHIFGLSMWIIMSIIFFTLLHFR